MNVKTVLLAACLLLLCQASSYALTAQEIANSVIAELQNISDYQASVDIDYTDPNVPDSSAGSLWYKRGATEPMLKQVMGSPYVGSVVTDGTGWNRADSTEEIYLTEQHGKDWVRDATGCDMFNMEAILTAETWTKAASLETVNGVSCYKLYTTKGASNYEVWIDAATAEKVICVKATDSGNVLFWKLDYSDFGAFGGGFLPTTIQTQRYTSDGSAVELTAVYTFSSISANQGIDNSVFAITKP